MDRIWLVVSLAQLGRFAEATEHATEAIRLAEPMQHPFHIAYPQRGAGVQHVIQGDWAAARARFERAIAVLRTGNVVQLQAATVAFSAWVLAQLGEAAEALNRIGDGERLVEQELSRGWVGDSGGHYHALGCACLLLDRLGEAQRVADRAIESSTHSPGYRAWALHLLGDIASHPDRFDAERGEAHYRQSLALAEPCGMRPLVAHCHLGLGKLYRHTGKQDESREHLTTATTMYRQMDMRFWLGQSESEVRSIL